MTDRGETAITRTDLDAAISEIRSEIHAAVNKLMLSQVAVAGLLFVAFRLFLLGSPG